MRGRALLVALVVALVGGALGQVPVCDSSSNHADIFCADGASAAVPSGGTEPTRYYGHCKMAPATACPEGWDDQTDTQWSQCAKHFYFLGSTVPACGACEVTSATIADLCCTDPEFVMAAGTEVGILGLLQPVDGSADCPSGWEFQDLGSVKQCMRMPVDFISAEACNCAAGGDSSWHDCCPGGDCWHDDDDDDDDDDLLDGGLREVMSLAPMGLAAIGITFTGITIATLVNLAQEQCALGPTIIFEAGTTHPYYITPNLCTIGAHTYSSKKTVRDATPHKVCRKFCEAASGKGKLALKHVQGLTCYCKRK
jgi:hypothetical protein